MEKNKKPERISKVIARSTPYSRRQVEQLIYDGRIRVDGKIIDKPGINVSKKNILQLDKKNIPLKMFNSRRNNWEELAQFAKDVKRKG